MCAILSPDVFDFMEILVSTGALFDQIIHTISASSNTIKQDSITVAVTWFFKKSSIFCSLWVFFFFLCTFSLREEKATKKKLYEKSIFNLFYHTLPKFTSKEQEIPAPYFFTVQTQNRPMSSLSPLFFSK